MKLCLPKYKYLKGLDPAFNNVNPERGKNHKILMLLLTLIAVLLVVLAMVLVFQTTESQSARRTSIGDVAPPILACYLTANPMWRQVLRAGAGLCSHVIVAFASVNNCSVQLDNTVQTTLQAARQLLPHHVKLMLSIGGAENNPGFSEMVRNHASRKIFIKSIKAILFDYSLDGIDIDWEFPGYRGFNMVKMINARRERQHFSQLLREIRAEFVREKKDYLLTVALAAQQIIAMVAYDIDQINLYVDFANIMSYDYHLYSSYTPFTGLNSPLYQRPNEHLYMATLNINFTVHWYVSQGLSPNKIVVGIPSYGHTFSLMNPDNHNVGSPAAGYGSLGEFVDYPKLCMFTKNNNSVPYNIKYDVNAQVPYLYSDKLWVSFELPESVEQKAKYIVQNKLRGAMVYSMNSDDYKGICSGGFGNNTAFPLIQTVKNTLTTCKLL